MTKLDLNFEPAEQLDLKDLNEHVLKAEYAIRGAIPMRAEQIQDQINLDPESVPFDKITTANIGNPQQLQQKPLTYSRQVVSVLQYPELLQHRDLLVKSGAYMPDALDRAKILLDKIGGSVGAYSSSQGVRGIRDTVAEYITRRDDGEPASPQDIFMTDGATRAVTYLLSLLCRGPQYGVLIPIPQYPVYTASLTLYNTAAIPYYLNEKSGWSTDAEEIEIQIKKTIAKGIKPSVIVVINPGNPTGSLLKPDVMEDIVTLAAKYGLVILADEVYQENVFSEGRKFYSFKSVLRSLQRRHKIIYDNVQLASIHSTSKGVFGECGQRGGYLELIGFRNSVREEILKLASLSICAVITGQAMVDLMVAPPTKGQPSYEMDKAERLAIHNTLKERGELLYNTFQELEGIECQRPQGAMYLFPRLYFSQKVYDAAKKADLQPDEFYCHALLESTGICVVPGTGFGQEEGTWHLRTTFLAPGTEWIQKWKAFHQDFYKKYAD
ncbi:similar to Saccharomyces cerevisiae YDR111C ALT2 Putative alanine transaminase (glutamic pyruvic transaminase) [Maudiozyma saulgeensis]|uniref:Glutamate pyruvate transaminase n=1 Tax=Maudiozyma saulgeensis TaxID=1789683 RepID=A0A1X7R6M0_9SACH|nr:similar to Saccharomyces cerevisiae YDR111C ALT2 Putative alanine transaminase (glutamic pyruvic transaminase) [Kazachstania saulgeensis]